MAHFGIGVPGNAKELMRESLTLQRESAIVKVSTRRSRHGDQAREGAAQLLWYVSVRRLESPDSRESEAAVVSPVLSQIGKSIFQNHLALVKFRVYNQLHLHAVEKQGTLETIVTKRQFCLLKLPLVSAVWKLDAPCQDKHNRLKRQMTKVWKFKIDRRKRTK